MAVVSRAHRVAIHTEFSLISLQNREFEGSWWDVSEIIEVRVFMLHNPVAGGNP
jgi:hypothetical protein